MQKLMAHAFCRILKYLISSSDASIWLSNTQLKGIKWKQRRKINPRMTTLISYSTCIFEIFFIYINYNQQYLIKVIYLYIVFIKHNPSCFDLNYDLMQWLTNCTASQTKEIIQVFKDLLTMSIHWLFT